MSPYHVISSFLSPFYATFTTTGRVRKNNMRILQQLSHARTKSRRLFSIIGVSYHRRRRKQCAKMREWSASSPFFLQEATKMLLLLQRKLFPSFELIDDVKGRRRGEGALMNLLATLCKINFRFLRHNATSAADGLHFTSQCMDHGSFLFATFEHNISGLDEEETPFCVEFLNGNIFLFLPLLLWDFSSQEEVALGMKIASGCCSKKARP